ncbi:P-type ATPase [Fusarium solani]|nr:P-type ATPase [Fusarium solani]
MSSETWKHFSDLDSRFSLWLAELIFATLSITKLNWTEVFSRLILSFRGLIGLYNRPRPESAPSVRQCHEAGVSVPMLSGDHPETARAIALEVGILPTKMLQIPADVAKTITKVRMINALHHRKCFIAMTGDGVNDYPGLKQSGIGIVMGLAVLMSPRRLLILS